MGGGGKSIVLERWLSEARCVWLVRFGGVSFCNFLDPSELKVIGCVFFDDFYAFG